MRSVGPKMENAVKAGAVKHFEIVYEVSWKLIERWCMSCEAPDTRRDLTHGETISAGRRNRLIDDFDQWRSYHDARNATAHTYGAARARAILERLPDFAHDARLLLETLEAHQCLT